MMLKCPKCGNQFVYNGSPRYVKCTKCYIRVDSHHDIAPTTTVTSSSTTTKTTGTKTTATTGTVSSSTEPPQ